ncbi:MAG: M48 family metalloprotease [Candidatus Thiodiazotropha sp. (ex Ctena orbiculata)]|uniref:M48 family metalloprotease n=1 Tax=Candidatus Thiodiazotropha taylori TaxID=2792791 RepID=A0A944M3M0_9GAMM|nr:M48 family metalloprotease [Candidatus Thiodiazotropha taylori]PUB84281.1 MAG: peptidase M48 [gamma proteobacterium symbiont of Ctena orbiculata]MBT2987401.1 M48 family metalloprotease [Candidatus Thiodiazotropha taylori]MBT2995345.1 M48 family metalloprotease [Candidatus Thiodiazotropha taylori]MBT3001805.1 M48 family metalloprotease [Candidatus Thiodiazotropha taylori]
MKQATYIQHKAKNLLQSLILIFSLGGLCAWLAWFLGGPPLAMATAIVILISYQINPVASPEWAMRLFRARRLLPEEAPALYQLMSQLGGRAGLERVPSLYYLPSDVMNAFTTGTRERAAIAISDGLLRRMEWRELAGVLAHELMHVVNQDTRLMAFADLTSRITGFLSLIGQLLLLINLPLMLFGETTLPWFPILLMLIAPTLSALAQLALSRSREYEADLGAARLTGDPVGLASALNQLEPPRHRLLERLLHPGPRIPDPSLLRTHPPTEERVERLMALTHLDTSTLGVVVSPRNMRNLLAHNPYRPRWHRNGMWY